MKSLSFSWILRQNVTNIIWIFEELSSEDCIMCHSAQTGHWTPSLSGPGPDSGSGSSAVRDSGEAGPGTQVSQHHMAIRHTVRRHRLISDKLNLGELIYNFWSSVFSGKKSFVEKKTRFFRRILVNFYVILSDCWTESEMCSEDWYWLWC